MAAEVAGGPAIGVVGIGQGQAVHFGALLADADQMGGLVDHDAAMVAIQAGDAGLGQGLDRDGVEVKSRICR